MDEKKEKAVELYLITNALNNLLMKQERKDFIFSLNLLINQYGEEHGLTAGEIVDMAKELGSLQERFQREIVEARKELSKE